MPPGSLRFSRASTTAALIVLLFAIDRAGPAGAGPVWAGNLLQLVLSLVAAACCGRAAGRARGTARTFWALFATAMFLWSIGQALWSLSAIPVGPGRILAAWDPFFLASSAPVLAAFLVRPDRRARAGPELPFDMALLAALALYVFVFFGLGYLVRGSLSAYGAWLNRLLALRGIVVLAWAGWLVHRATGDWARTYSRLAAALVLFHGGSAISNLALVAGRYRPGLYDVPWTIPFLWIAFEAAEWLPSQAGEPARPRDSAPWRETRQGTALALVTVVAVPTLHLLMLSLRGFVPLLTIWRAQLTLATTLLVGSLFLARQLTGLKRAELTLRQSSQRYRSLFDTSPLPMWVYDLESLAFLEINEAAVREYGYSREEFLARGITDIRPQEDVPAVVESLSQVQALRAERQAWRHRRKDGRVFDVEITSAPIEWLGRSARLVMAVDVTERRRLEEQLVQSQKVEAIGRLAGGIAHDFNNLLGVITGYGDLLWAELSDGDPRRRRVEQIRKASDRAAGLTRQLLAFSRKQVLQPRILDLNHVVRDMETMLRRLIAEDIHLTTVTGQDVGRVRADPSQLEQVIMNLVVNARDAMPLGGSLTLATHNQEVPAGQSGVPPGRYVVLSVTDTGVGMDAETQSHVFEPFFTTKEVGKGTGLGLATVYGIVRQSEGHIVLDTAPGRGSTFRIYLPEEQEAAPAEAVPASAGSQPLGRETILLAEDEDGLRALVREILEERGYLVIAAGSGPQALELGAQCPQGDLHLLLTDVVLPGMSGRSLAEQLALRHPALGVLYMSGYTDDALGHHGVLDATTNFLHKPFTADALLHRVRNVLDTHNAPVRPS
jgi:PAS domain S-box-containing protein